MLSNKIGVSSQPINQLTVWFLLLMKPVETEEALELNEGVLEEVEVL